MATRRSFLGTLTTTAAGASLLPHISRAEIHIAGKAYAGPPLRIALMGLGGYASIVAKAVQSAKNVKITGLISGTPAKLKEWGNQYNVPEKNQYNYETYDNIKDNEEIDAVYVTTPNALHSDNVIHVAKAAKHAICEKPMAINPAEGRAMIDACKKANVKLFIGYRMHFEPHTVKVMELRKAGEFGPIRFFQGLTGFVIGDPKQWRMNRQLAGGGAMMDIGIYSINGARYMVGEDPVWVTAQEVKTRPDIFSDGVDETITFQFGFPGGAVASCVSTYNFNYLDRFYMVGEKGAVELNPASGYAATRATTNKGPVEAPDVVHQANQLDYMADMIFKGKQAPVPVDGEEGLKDLIIIEAIYEAVKTGKKVEIKLV